MFRMSEKFALIMSISIDFVVIIDLICLVISFYMLLLCGFEDFYENYRSYG